jgi:uncharacterized LabA/DUF88 family protein
MVRVAVYVDGFNLYNGLHAKHGRKYLWLDLEAMSRSLLRPQQQLVGIKYFTARIRGDLASLQRQSVYLDALVTHCPLVAIVEGRFQKRVMRCWDCGVTRDRYVEKQTDANIVASILVDAARDRFDVALLVSADADLCSALLGVRELYPNKKVIVAFPPRRNSAELKKLADGFITIGDDKIRRAQLPDDVIVSPNVVLHRPKYWS